jgi:hypothetical protein
MNRLALRCDHPVAFVGRSLATAAMAACLASLSLLSVPAPAGQGRGQLQ